MHTYLQDLDAMAWRVEWTPSVTDTPQRIWKILIFFSEVARTRTGAMRQLVGKGGSGEPHHTHYSPQCGDKEGDKVQLN